MANGKLVWKVDQKQRKKNRRNTSIEKFNFQIKNVNEQKMLNWNENYLFWCAFAIVGTFSVSITPPTSTSLGRVSAHSTFSKTKASCFRPSGFIRHFLLNLCQRQDNKRNYFSFIYYKKTFPRWKWPAGHKFNVNYECTKEWRERQRRWRAAGRRLVNGCLAGLK